MMGHDAIKLELIEWLTKIDDDETIEYLKLVKDSASSEEDWWHYLTLEQKLGIEQGLRDIDEGRVIPDEEVKKKYGI
jgi:hypothetical protein